MTYSCPVCGFSYEGIAYPPFCPFCRTSYRAEDRNEFFASVNKDFAERRDKDGAQKLVRAAENGNTEAAYLYGNCLLNGIGVRRSPALAVNYYHYAASRAHVEAAYALGIQTLHSRDDKERAAALFWLRYAAERGNPEAAAIYGECAGDDALYYLTIAACAGNKRAAVLAAEKLDAENDRANYPRIKGFLSLAGNTAFSASLLVAKTVGVPAEMPKKPDDKSGARRLKLAHAAEAEGEYYLALVLYGEAVACGQSDAAVAIGDAFFDGVVQPKNASVAGKWYLRAADVGNIRATVKLGSMFRAGEGVERDTEKALLLFNRCACLGDAEAEFLAAEMYFEGISAPRDIPLALSLYQKAADHGYAPAIDKQKEISEAVSGIYNRAAAAFDNGDYEAAVKDYRIAAEFGHSGAITNLGVCYQNGYGCEKNLKTAMTLYRQAVLYGKAAARYNLGLCYLRNYGVRFDPVRASELLLASGYPDAEDLIKEMKARKEKKAARHLYAVSSILFMRGETKNALRARLLAAKLGIPEAAALIGCHYEFGVEVESDMDNARRYYLSSGLPLAEIDRLKRGFLKQLSALSAKTN